MVANGRKVAKCDPAVCNNATFVLLEAAVDHALGPAFHRQWTCTALFDVLGVVLIERLGLDSGAGFDDASLADPLANAVGLIAVGSRRSGDCCRWPQAITLPCQGTSNGPVEYSGEFT